MASSDDDRAKYDEGPEAARRAEQTLSRVLAVSKEELAKREAAYKKARRKQKSRQPTPSHR